jgi:hypothetical protein
MSKKYNLTAIVVFISLVEGLAVYINNTFHPELQPLLTVIIVDIATGANGLVTWYFTKIRPGVCRSKAVGSRG